MEVNFSGVRRVLVYNKYSIYNIWFSPKYNVYLGSD